MNKLSKIFAGIITIVFLFTDISFAFAQLDVPTSNSALGTGGIAGSIVNTAAETVFQTATGINEGCAKAEEAFSKIDHGTEFAFGGLSLIGGGAAEAAYLESKAIKIEGFLTCRQRARDALKGMITPNLITSQKKQRLEEEINLAVDGLNKRKQDIQARQNIAKRGFWKSLVVKMLLSTTKAVTAKLVNSLAQKFKINNYLSYADAVAGNVYAAQLINSNIKDGKDQLIARSLLTDPVVQNQIQPAIFQRANTALGFNPDDLDLTDANFYQKSFQVGSGNTNAFLMQVQALDNADQIKAQSLTSAKTEISLGNGLKAPKTCDGSIAAQAAIDAEYKAVNNEIQNRTKLLQDLQNYRTVARNLTPAEAQQLDADIKKAEKDFNDAGQKLNDLPKKYKSPVVQICKDITSPASLVNMGINEAFSSFAGKMSDYNDNNLPFFVNFISDIGTQIGTSLIFGGNTGSTLLNESGNLAQAASLGISLAKNEQAESNLAKGVRFDYEKSSNFSDAYTLSWDIVDVKDAEYITIKGTGISDAQHLPLSGSTEVRTSANSTYLLKVFDKTGKMLTSASLDLEVEAANPYLGGSSGPMVRGASIVKSMIPIRGPIGISPRGSY